MGLALVASILFVGCSGGAAGDPNDDIGDIFVISTSPGNGDQLDLEDSNGGYNALDRDDLVTKDSVTVVFSNSLDTTSVINPDPSDPQGTRNVRLFYFDLDQGPFDPDAPRVPGVNPPGANVLIEADSFPTQVGSVPFNALVITPTGITATEPMREGQYSVVVSPGVRGADGDGMKGQSYFFYYRVGQDTLGPTVTQTVPVNNAQGVAPDSEIRITLSETILASTVTTNSISVDYTPAGSTNPIAIPGTWYTDGGNGPGNNFPNLQLDFNGNPGFSGVSPRNGADLVFRPALDQFPVNFAAFDPFDPTCPFSDPPRKGNQGYPHGQAVQVTFIVAGAGVTDTAGNRVPIGSPNTSFTFFTEPLPDPVYAPQTSGAVYFGDTFGVGAIDVNSARTPYLVGPNPSRPPNTVVRAGASNDPNAKVVRVPIPDLVDMTTDTRPYTSFYSMFCNLPPPLPPPAIMMGNLYAASGSLGGGQVIVVDAYRMIPLGRFSTPSPGGVAVTANGTAAGAGRLAVSNFSANTVTLFDISTVMWFKDNQGALPARVNTLANNVFSGQAKLILNPGDFEEAFPLQRQTLTSP
ncbi:MAG: Ig-like domain-containing domain, partial [Planctomycetota bacterium]